MSWEMDVDPYTAVVEPDYVDIATDYQGYLELQDRLNEESGLTWIREADAKLEKKAEEKAKQKAKEQEEMRKLEEERKKREEEENKSEESQGQTVG